VATQVLSCSAPLPPNGLTPWHRQYCRGCKHGASYRRIPRRKYKLAPHTGSNTIVCSLQSRLLHIQLHPPLPWAPCTLRMALSLVRQSTVVAKLASGECLTCDVSGTNFDNQSWCLVHISNKCDIRAHLMLGLKC
jgi:hypothetical protein